MPAFVLQGVQEGGQGGADLVGGADGLGNVRAAEAIGGIGRLADHEPGPGLPPGNRWARRRSSTRRGCSFRRLSEQGNCSGCGPKLTGEWIQ